MDSDRWSSLKQAFEGALQVPPERLESYLEEVCAGDAALRRELQALLDSDSDAASFMEVSPTPAGLGAVGEESLVGVRIGQYTVDEVISSGGMGTVYRARQEQPHRTVAIKVLRTGISLRSAQRRFEYESEILARLGHPNVAQVIEAGTHTSGAEGIGSGLPYFVMEYVPEAATISEHVARHHLSIRAVLELFLQVCAGVHHGHQKGVIHRDLKPGNILVTRSGQVKIIDFGIARTVGSDLDLTSVHTDVGQLIGTLQYMSPEQCSGNPADLDVRSDVYALGVVLYELLCGQPPYEVRDVALLEGARRVREAEPHRPSVLQHRLRGDVETILQKALEKDREQRYESVQSFAEDLQRHLDGQVIRARAVGPATRLMKAIRRNPLVSASLAAGGLALIGTFVYVVAWSLPQLRQERNRAQVSADTAHAANLFLERMLTAADPLKLGRDVKVVDVLDHASAEIDRSESMRPRVMVGLRSMLGQTYGNLGYQQAAARELRHAFDLNTELDGPDHPITLMIQKTLSQQLRLLGRTDEAEELIRDGVERCLRSLGDGHTVTIKSLQELAQIVLDQGHCEEAETLSRQALKLCARHGLEDTEVPLDARETLADSLWRQGDSTAAERIRRENLAQCRARYGETGEMSLALQVSLAGDLRRLGRVAEAERMVREALPLLRQALGDRHVATAGAKGILGHILMEQGHLEEAERLDREALQTYLEIKGPERRLTMQAMNNLACCLEVGDQLEEAEELHRQNLEMRERRLGADHPDTLMSRVNLARVLRRTGAHEEAESLLRTVVEARRARLGDSHPDTLTAMHNLAHVLRIRGDLDECELLLEEILEVVEPESTELVPERLRSVRLMAHVYRAQGGDAKALALLERYVKLHRDGPSAGQFELLTTMGDLAVDLDRAGRAGEAEEMFRAVLAGRRAALGQDSLRTVKAMRNLAVYCDLHGNHAEAEDLCRQVLDVHTRIHGPEHEETLKAVNRLGEALLQQELLDEAEEVLADGLEVAERVHAEHGITALLHLNLGDCLTRMELFEEAEQHLLQGQRGFQEIFGRGHERTRSAARLLTTLYERWDRPIEARQWSQRAGESTPER